MLKVSTVFNHLSSAQEADINSDTRIGLSKADNSLNSVKTAIQLKMDAFSSSMHDLEHLQDMCNAVCNVVPMRCHLNAHEDETDRQMNTVLFGVKDDCQATTWSGKVDDVLQHACTPFC